MKAAKIIWIAVLALASMTETQAQTGTKKQKSYGSGQSETASAINGSPRPSAAYFLGADAEVSASGAGSDHGLIVAYEAILAAKARIQSNRRCQRFFHEQGVETLEKTRYTLQYHVPSIGAQVEGAHVLLNLSPDGVFMKPPQVLAGLTHPGEIRAFYILHELAHELSRFTKYLSDHTASPRVNQSRTKLNNDLLIQNCY